MRSKKVAPKNADAKQRADAQQKSKSEQKLAISYYQAIWQAKMLYDFFFFFSHLPAINLVVVA